MRKLYKNMIFELLETLRTAASEAKNLFAKNDTDVLINLLADCQDCANQIGELVAEFEGEEHITISYLREYCEMLYRISLEADKTDYDIDIKKELRKQLAKIRNSVENDIKTTIEVVFFPYKASMFDALESVWLATKDDPDCDAYVVPIPYYDRNPDHSLGQMHYEGGEYPDYVPVVDWKRYNVEERRPDVIFVHNPYDEGNYVTSVHPDYYSKRLREFTDCLCYSPYFVVVNDNLEEHFATNAGCVYAHKVFVQSDKVRDLYIKYFKKNFVDKYGKAEDKFFALGSPKHDRVLNTKKEDCKLPDKWRRLIEKPDGSRKKVIFYNTTLSMMLNKSEKYLVKLQYVLNAFKERDDIVLWWRPHPLMEQTINSMRPGLARAYNGVVRAYRNDGFGIYDDTADLHRAIAWSDAYFGDYSSLVSMYIATDKPIMAQNIEIIPKKFECRKSFIFSFSEDNELLSLNVLGSVAAVSVIDIATLSEKHYCEYPSFEGNSVSLFDSYTIAKKGSQLYFAPCWNTTGDHIAVYDVNTKAFEFIPIKCEKEKLLADNPYNCPIFLRIIHYKNALYIIPRSYPAIVKIDLSTKTVSYFSDFVKELLSIKSKSENAKGYAFFSSVPVGNKVYVCCRWAGLLVEFNLDNYNTDIIKINGLNHGNNSILSEGENIWIFTETGNIIKWNTVTKKTQSFNTYPSELTSTPTWGTRVVYNGFIYAATLNDNKLLLRINTTSGEISVATEIADMLDESEHITSFRTQKDNLYFLTDESRIFEISDFNQSPRIGKISLSDEEITNLHKRLYEYHCNGAVPILTEREGMSCEKYIDLVIDEEFKEKTPSVHVQNSGKAIYEHIKSMYY